MPATKVALESSLVNVTAHYQVLHRLECCDFTAFNWVYESTRQKTANSCSAN